MKLGKRRKISLRVLAGALAVGLATFSPMQVFAAVGDQWINTNIIGHVTADTPVNIRDDFALGANYDRLLTMSIGAGRLSTGGMADAAAYVMEQEKTLIGNPDLKGEDAELVNTIAEITGNWDERNRLGAEPLMPTVNEILGIQTLEDALAFSCDTSFDTNGLSWPSVSTTTALDYPEYYTLLIDQLPMEFTYGDYYSADLPQLKTARDRDHKNAIYMLERIGFGEAQAEDIYQKSQQFEQLLVPYMYGSYDAVQSDFQNRCNNSYTREQLQELSGDFPLVTILDAWGLGGSAAYMVKNPPYLKGLGSIWKEENMGLYKSFLLVRFLQSNIVCIDRAAYDFAMKAAGGIEPAQEEYVVLMVQRYGAGALGNLYQKAYCSAQNKAEIRQICDDITAYYRTMLQNETWLSDETKAAAIRKLDNLLIYACYPDEPHEDSTYPVAKGSTFIELKQSFASYEAQKMRDNINKKVDREAWNIKEPYEVNANYIKETNAIAIYSGLLNGLGYRSDWSYEQKLGFIGTIIGHEISHAFDSEGALYDETGKRRNWWTLPDAFNFVIRVNRLVDYYDALTVEGTDVPCVGMMIDGEATADIVGMKAVLGIAAEKKDFDYDRFFRSYAALWNIAMTPQQVDMRMASDTHPIGYLRINCLVQQFEEFYKTYDVQPGDGMYLAPEDRLQIW